MCFRFVSIAAKCAQNWDCTSKKIWFWCRLQGSQVSERSVLSMDMSNMYVTLQLNWSSSSDPQEMTPLGGGGVGSTHLLSKSCFRVNSSIIGFSPKKKMFLATLQSSRFALAYLTWAYGSSQSLLLARPSSEFVRPAAQRSCRRSEDHSFSILPCIQFDLLYVQRCLSFWYRLFQMAV